MKLESESRSPSWADKMLIYAGENVEFIMGAGSHAIGAYEQLTVTRWLMLSCFGPVRLFIISPLFWFNLFRRYKFERKAGV